MALFDGLDSGPNIFTGIVPEADQSPSLSYLKQLLDTTEDPAEKQKILDQISAQTPDPQTQIASLDDGKRAMATLGTINGASMRSKPEIIQDYLKNGGVNLNPAEYAWCAAAMNSSMKQAGVPGTGSNMARSFLNWGSPVDDPKPGDVAVFSRGGPNSNLGHVGFFNGYDENGNIQVFGGNQSKGVNVTTMPADKLLGFRRAPDATDDPIGSVMASKTQPTTIPYAQVASNDPNFVPSTKASPKMADTPDDSSGFSSKLSGLFNDPMFMVGMQILSNSMVKRPLTAQISPFQGVPELLAATQKTKLERDKLKQQQLADQGAAQPYPGSSPATTTPTIPTIPTAAPVAAPNAPQSPMGGLGGLGGIPASNIVPETPIAQMLPDAPLPPVRPDDLPAASPSPVPKPSTVPADDSDTAASVPAPAAKPAPATAIAPDMPAPVQAALAKKQSQAEDLGRQMSYWAGQIQKFPQMSDGARKGIEAKITDLKRQYDEVKPDDFTKNLSLLPPALQVQAIMAHAQVGPVDATKTLQDRRALQQQIAAGQVDPSELALFDKKAGLVSDDKDADKLQIHVTGQDPNTGAPVYSTFNPKTGEVKPLAAPAGTAPTDGRDPNLTGDDFLQTLPLDRRNQIKAMVEGRQPPISSFALSKPANKQLLADANQYDPTFDASNWASRSATNKEFHAGGPSSPAAQITAGNTAIQHLGHLVDLADKLNNGSFTPWNSVANSVSSAVGDNTAVKSFDTVRDLAAAEITKFYKGTVNKSDMEEVQKNISSSNTPAQLAETIKAQVDAMNAKINALQDRWHNAMGPNVKDFEIIQPESQAAIKKINAFADNGGKMPDEYRQGATPTSTAKQTNATQPSGLKPGRYVYDPAKGVLPQ